MDQTSEDLDAFRARVYLRGRELYRDLPWRRTRDAYAIWVSEAMLQQTQVSRVDGRWQRWLERFPSMAALAAASSADVLDEWQGLGYNRRALALWRAAGQIVSEHGGRMPIEERDLRALPGIGPATAAGIRAFAYDLPGVYLETNVRTVFLHELFPGEQDVPDSALRPLVAEACPEHALSVAGADAPRLAAGTMPCSTTDTTSSRRCPTRLVALARMSGSRASRGRTGKSGPPSCACCSTPAPRARAFHPRRPPARSRRLRRLPAAIPWTRHMPARFSPNSSARASATSRGAAGSLSRTACRSATLGRLARG